MKLIARLAALGVLAMACEPASAQVGRFDPALRTAQPMPITTVQADEGGFLPLPPGAPGAGAGRRAAPRAPANAGGGGGPRFGGGEQRFGGGQAPDAGRGFGPRQGGPGPQFGRGPGPRYYGGDGRRRRDGFGVGAGIAAGALLGGAIAAQSAPAYGYRYGYVPDADDEVYAPPPPPPAAVYADTDADASYCARRYRSYDPSSGTYLGYDGLRHPCP